MITSSYRLILGFYCPGTAAVRALLKFELPTKLKPLAAAVGGLGLLKLMGLAAVLGLKPPVLCCWLTCYIFLRA